MSETLKQFCDRKGLLVPYDPGIDGAEFFIRWNYVFTAQFAEVQERQAVKQPDPAAADVRREVNRA